MDSTHATADVCDERDDVPTPEQQDRLARGQASSDLLFELGTRLARTAAALSREGAGATGWGSPELANRARCDRPIPWPSAYTRAREVTPASRVRDYEAGIARSESPGGVQGARELPQTCAGSAEKVSLFAAYRAARDVREAGACVSEAAPEIARDVTQATPRQALVLCIGIPASGKTVWAHSKVSASLVASCRALQFKRVCKDDLREMLDNSYWTPENEKLVDQGEMALTRIALDNGYSVVIDATNVGKRRVERFNEIVKRWYSHRVDLVLKWFDTPLDTCHARNALRQGRTKVPVSALDSMYGQYVERKERYAGQKYNI